MNVRSPIFGFLILLILATSMAPLPVRAQASPAACKQEMYDRMGHEERLYRSILFGQIEAKNAPTGSVRFDAKLTTWMKTGSNQWKSIDTINRGVTRTDGNMEAEADVPMRRGILEVRSAFSSELIPPVLQAMRALQCRMRAICLGINESRRSADATITVTPEGCTEFTIDALPSCRSPDGAMDSGECDAVIDTIMEREEEMLKLIFAYDAAYRTLLQFAGNFDGFLTDFRFPLLQPLWQMIRALGVLDNLPCFLSECHE